MLKKYNYWPVIEEVADEARKIFEYKEDECITYTTLKERILEQFKNIQIGLYEDIQSSYIYYLNNTYFFVIKTGDSLKEEVLDLSMLFFYYYINMRNGEIKNASYYDICNEWGVEYLAQAFLLPRSIYQKAFNNSLSADSSTVSIDNMCKELWGMNSRIVYVRGRYLQYYH